MKKRIAPMGMTDWVKRVGICGRLIRESPFRMTRTSNPTQASSAKKARIMISLIITKAVSYTHLRAHET